MLDQLADLLGRLLKARQHMRRDDFGIIWARIAGTEALLGTEGEAR